MAEKKTIPLGPVGENVRSNIERLRDRKRLTFKELAERLNAHGRKIPILGLRRIERGERRVDADDLMAFALAFGVNINSLVMPYTAGGPIALTDQDTVDAKTAWQWADGRRPLYIPDGDDGTAQVEFQRDARPVGMRLYGFNDPGRRARYEDADGVGYPHATPGGGATIKQPEGCDDLEVPPVRTLDDNTN